MTERPNLAALLSALAALLTGLATFVATVQGYEKKAANDYAVVEILAHQLATAQKGECK